MGMKVQWRKNGVTSQEVCEVVKIEALPSGKTVVHLKGEDGIVAKSLNAGNRYILAG